MRLLLFITALLLPISAPAFAQKPTKQDRKAALLTVEEAESRIEVRGTDPLDPLTIVSSQPFLKYRGADKFLRAMIDKKSGAVVYQLYLFSVTPKDALKPRLLTYLVGDTPEQSEVDRIDFDVKCSRYGCTYYEDSIAEFPREHLDIMAAGAVPGINEVASMKIFGQTTTGYPMKLLKTEIAGFLNVVDRQLSRMSGQ